MLCSKSTIKTLEKRCFYCWLWPYFFTPLSRVSIADFEQENVNWELINSADFKNRTEIETTDSSYETETITK